MGKYTRLLFSMPIILLALPTLVTAQEGDSSGDREAFEEIIVTAQKREQRLLEVPMAVAAFRGLELEQRGLRSIQDVTFAVPGMTSREDGPGSYKLFLRGVSNQYGPGALVGVYMDEAPLNITGNDQLDVRIMDLDRMEVLKGPQGTLYGEGALAGAVRYVTNDPEVNRFSGDVEAGFLTVSEGDTGHRFTGVLNMPVVEDKFALRLAAQFEGGGGWIDQPEADIEDGNGGDLINLRLKALWNVSDSVQAKAMVISHSLETDLGQGYEEPDRTNLVGVDRSKVMIPKDFDYTLSNLNLTFDLGGMELITSSTYIDHEHQYPFSYIGGEATIYGGGGALEGNDDRWVTAEQFTQELRLSSTGDGPLNWTVGGFYRDAERSLYVEYVSQWQGAVFGGLIYEDGLTYESYAFFAEGSYDLTDRISAGAGIRYFSDDQSNFDGSNTEEDSFDSTDPRVWMSYALSDNANLYASISQGFRSGGFNRGDSPNYDAEDLTNYEVGYKAVLAGGAVDLELAAFFTDYSDMLRRGLVFVEPTFQSLISNIGDVDIVGFEAGITVRPSDQLSLSATLASLDSEVKEVRSDDAVNIAGDPVDYTPDISFTLGAYYSFDWASGRPGFARLDYYYRDSVSYVDRSSFADPNIPQFSDDIGLLDARIGVEFGGTTVEFYGTNLTDENKWIDPYHAWANANRTRPRVLGILARVGFD